MIALALLLLTALASTPSRAQQSGLAANRAAADAAVGLMPSERVNVAIVGDSLADGVWGGLYRFLVRDKRHTVTRATRNSIGFAGGDLLDLLDPALQTARPDGIVMMIGANDRRSLFVDGRSVALLGTPQWRELYLKRVAGFVQRVEREAIPMVWILPPVARAVDADNDYRMVAELIRAATIDRPGVYLLDARQLTADENGRYRSHYKDLAGRVQSMRADDGIHFTPPGYEIIAVQALAMLRQNVSRFAEVADLPTPSGTATR